jgi:hypothetical protein
VTDIDYASRVARGIALMDEKWPRWATEIDLEELDIEDGSHCVTAQYAAAQGEVRNWKIGMSLLGLDMEAYTEEGFRTYDEDQDDYPVLNRLWRDEILRRRAQADTAPAEPEASS